MRTLAEAWDWYLDASKALRLFKRLGAKHWKTLDHDGPIIRDDRFRHLEADEIKRLSDSGLGPLDDLAVLVLFSVFEAEVRALVRSEIAEESSGIRHPTLRHAAAEVVRQIEEGSFFRVVEPFKEDHADLVESVNQVRRYRNWVAHGRRADRPAAVDPRMAYERLSDFLQAITAP